MQLSAHLKKLFICFALIVTGVALDQWSKVSIQEHFVEKIVQDTVQGPEERRIRKAPPIVIVEDLFHLNYVENPGITFGMLRSLDDKIRRPLLISFPLIVMCLLLFLIVRTPRTEHSSYLGFACIVSGAIGNIIDRIRLNYVIDFLDVFWADYHWPAFNVADSYICVGMGLLFLVMLQGKDPFRLTPIVPAPPAPPEVQIADAEKQA